MVITIEIHADGKEPGIAIVRESANSATSDAMSGSNSADYIEEDILEGTWQDTEWQ